MRTVLLELLHEHAAYRRTLSGAMLALTQPLTLPMCARVTLALNPNPNPVALPLPLTL